jgi:hypothetical protein
MAPRPLDASLVHAIFAKFALGTKLEIGDLYNAGGKIFEVYHLELISSGIYTTKPYIAAKLRPISESEIDNS